MSGGVKIPHKGKGPGMCTGIPRLADAMLRYAYIYSLASPRASWSVF